MRTSADVLWRDGTGRERVLGGFDYRVQAWVSGGRYVACAHPASMNCRCFGRIHAGERSQWHEEG